MNDSIEERVYALVAKERGVKREKLTPNSTLSHDLGMEGDDAVEFFEKFAKEFSVDLKRLGEDWKAYFSAEGMGLGGLLLLVVPSALCAVILGLAFASLPAWLCGTIGIVSWMAAIYYWQKMHPGPQISIQDLIECARVGVWAKDLPPNANPRAAKYQLNRWLVP
jgi:acyl carrier protein